MNVVLVGGMKDGERVTLRDGLDRFECVENTSVSAEINAKPEAIIYKKHGYNLFKLHPATQTVVFAHEDMTPVHVMEQLIDGYHPRRKE